MATQSSTAVMFRALVMLACLVAIPLAAVFGRSLSEVFQSVLGGRWPAGSAGAPAPLGKTSLFQPLEPTDTAETSPARGIAPDRREPPRQDAGSWPDRAADPSASMVTAAGYASSSAGAPAEARQFTHLQDRLRQLGATHLVLESWGDQGQLCRFRCTMAVRGSPDYSRYFEATDSEPLRSMARVLQQVESWRAGRP